MQKSWMDTLSEDIVFCCPNTIYLKNANIFETIELLIIFQNNFMISN